MRTIKFRVWDNVSNVMDYDFIQHETNGDKYFVDIQDGELTVSDVDKNNDYYELILMQFTGLKDKNGREIYEGDILDHKPYDIPRVVIYNEASFSLKSKYDSPIVMCNENLRFLEVIGNIHENKELLK